MSGTTLAITDLAAYPAKYFGAWNQRDLDAALAVIADSVDWRDPASPEPMTDHESAGAFFSSAWSGFPDMQMHGLGTPLVDLANRRVSQEWRLFGTHTGEGFPPGVPATGRSFDVVGMDVWEVDGDGRAAVVHAYWSPADLLTQLGLV